MTLRNFALNSRSFIFFPGFLLNFVSAPVISAFTSTVAIQVATSQVKGLLGLKVKKNVKSWTYILPGCLNQSLYRDARSLNLHSI